jgi:hypothetical protein
MTGTKFEYDTSSQSSEKTFSVRKLARQYGFDERDRNQKRNAFDIAASQLKK